MATAKQVWNEREVKVTKKVQEYELTISNEQFTALAVLVGSISGDFTHPLRMESAKLWEDLFEQTYINTDCGEDWETFKEMSRGFTGAIARVTRGC